MSRWKAFAIHFCISLAVFLVLLAIIVFIWYPGILFGVDGGWNGLRIIIGVDLVLGPLLTLIVFKTGKPSLKFDLSCIATFQILCLLAGTWIVYGERPLALILAYDTIYALAAQEFELYERDITFIDDYPGSSPKMIYVELPEDEVSAEILYIRSQFIDDPLFVQTELFKPMPTDDYDILSIFRREDAVRSTVTEELLARLDEDCVLTKFISTRISGYVCFDPRENQLTRFYDNQYIREEETD
ncbi:MAG: hypothetical protein QGG67_15325 [Gammaproteobacteria bacterium]|nr:hypothetical protein [Gammaproteobacteria bacterium]MDP6097335.1 hypothetical protein [Gammaproteobacteria bacterium]